MSKEIISTDNAPGAIGPYNQAVKANGMVFCSGQIPIDPASGKITAETVKDQTDQVLKNLSAVLEAAGAGLADVVKTTVFLADMGYFQEMNEVYASYFTENQPARAAVAARELPMGVKVEIEAIAIAR
jgi:2-iminobutanoate/2-iminopropanoate deaminase